MEFNIVMINIFKNNKKCQKKEKIILLKEVVNGFKINNRKMLLAINKMFVLIMFVLMFILTIIKREIEAEEVGNNRNKEKVKEIILMIVDIIKGIMTKGKRKTSD